MARQTWAALAALYPDNTAGAISPADLRAGLIDSMRPHVTSSAPDASDDETLGFDIGHAWIDTSTTPASVYECVDATTASAVWVKRYPQDAGGSGEVEVFTDLDDTPSDYTGEGGKYLAVTGEEDGLEFVDAPSGATPDWGDIGGTISDQTDLQNALDAKLGRHAIVNGYSGNRTLDNDDSGAYVRITAAGTVTLPDGLSTGFQCVIVNATDSATVFLSAETALTLPSGFDAEVQNRKAVTVIHVGSNVWEAHGALVESS